MRPFSASFKKYMEVEAQWEEKELPLSGVSRYWSAASRSGSLKSEHKQNYNWRFYCLKRKFNTEQDSYAEYAFS